MSTDPRPDASASVFTARGGTTTPRRGPRRRAVARIRRLALGGAGLAALAALSLAAATATTDSVAARPDVAVPGATAPPASGAESAEDATTPTVGTPEVAHLGRVTLHLPSPSATFVGFHEAASTTALALTASSELTTDLTHREVLVTPRSAGDLGIRPVVVLPPRGRAAPATSAIDIVLPADAEVLAPVTGTVVEVQSYSLYRRHPDVRIGIVPAVDPSVEVTIIHIEDATVTPGDEVVAGETVIASRPNRLPFGSQIDDLTARSGEQADPHVHLEVKPRS